MKRFPVQPFKDKNFCLDFHRLMVRARVLEERLIKMVKSGEGHFWIGGPGEEAFNVSLGLQIKKGQGLAYDFLHLHYRSNAVLLAMGMPMIEFIRQMASVATDPFSGGRNFTGHPAFKAWNVAPVTSTIETQYLVAPGTAMAQRTLHQRGEESGITVVTGGDAGTAEGDFASCLVWSSRPKNELPLLIVVTNNGWGISTSCQTQHGEKHIADRAKAFGIKSQVADGNQVEKAWAAVEDALSYVRESRQPYFLEVLVSRLYGHSSSSGANRIEGELCPIEAFEKKLEKQGFLNPQDAKKVWEEAWLEANEALESVRKEKEPDPESVYHHSFFAETHGGVPGRDF